MMDLAGRGEHEQVKTELAGRHLPVPDMGRAGGGVIISMTTVELFMQ